MIVLLWVLNTSSRQFIGGCGRRSRLLMTLLLPSTWSRWKGHVIVNESCFNFELGFPSVGIVGCQFFVVRGRAREIVIFWKSNWIFLFPCPLGSVACLFFWGMWGAKPSPNAPFTPYYLVAWEGPRGREVIIF